MDILEKFLKYLKLLFINENNKEIYFNKFIEKYIKSIKVFKKLIVLKTTKLIHFNTLLYNLNK